MDIQPTTTQPISDDQELAKALAGIADEPAVPEPTAVPAAVVAPASPALPAFPGSTPAVPATPIAPAGASSDLNTIKTTALNELRPLIDKVELPIEEKFDVYLMLIRNTDDTSLIAPAHAAAQAISDEKRRAEALLDIIKEIDFLSHKDQPAV